MTVTRNRLYELTSVGVRMDSRALDAVVGIGMAVGAGLLGMSVARTLQTPFELACGMAYLFLGSIGLGLLVSYILKQKKEILGLAGEAERLWKEAVARDDGNELFYVFPPTQEEVDAELTRRGRGMGRACRALAAFSQQHPEVLAARAKGDPSDIAADILMEEEVLKIGLDEAKKAFWELHSMLWRKARPRIDLHDTWQAYDGAASSSAGDGDIV